ncbi:hypothetical protein [Nocardia sp. NPDC024068]|uniref:hypothetical protein n=1 Tax=Nocardia sp. NPDC024068 TaxID=3157197 RepID=UPI0033F54F48
MTGTHYRQPDGIAEFADELRLLAEAVLERVEPVLRAAASEDLPEWSSCTWCPVCAAAALVRGEHHEVLAAVATHGTAIVTVLREALAGVPVGPLAAHDHHHPESAATPGHTAGSEPAAEDRAAPGSAGAAENTGAPGPGAGTAGKSRYVGIPVNIKQ